MNYLYCCVKKEGILQEVKNRIIDISKDIKKAESDEILAILFDLYSNHEDFGAKEIESLFFKRLNSGRHCALRVKKVADENLCIYGTALVSEEVNFQCYPPVLFTRQEFEKEIYDDEVKSIEDIKVNLSARNSAMDFQGVAEFIKNNGQYNLGAVISILIDELKEGGVIRIRDKKENILWLLAGLEMAFPLEIAHNINFSIEYHFNISECLISGNSRKKGKEYLVDFYSPLKPEIKSNHRFTKLVDMAYFISPDTLYAFHNFLKSINYMELDENIENAYNLFNIVYFGIGKMSIGEVENALDFGIENSSPEFVENILVMIVPVLEKAYKDISPDTAEVFLDFLFNASMMAKNKLLISSVYEFFFNLIDYMAFNRKEFNEDEIDKIYKKIKYINRNNIRNFVEYSINMKRIKFIISLMKSDPNIFRVSFYARTIFKDLVDSGYLWHDINSDKELYELINIFIERIVASEENYKGILQSLYGNVELFSYISLMFYNKVISIEAVLKYIEAFSMAIEKTTDEFARDVRRAVGGMNNGSRFLFEEYEYEVKQGNIDGKILWRYMDDEKEKFFDYIEKYLPDMIKLYLKYTESDDIESECSRLLKYVIKEEISVDDYTAGLIVREYEKKLGVLKPSDDEISFIEMAREFKSEREIRTYPNIIEILYRINLINKGSSPAEVLNDDFSIEGIDEDNYLILIDWCLGNILKNAKTVEDLSHIVNCFCIGGMEKQFLDIYILSLEETDIEFKSILNMLFSYFYYIAPRLLFEGSGEFIKGLDDRIISRLKIESVLTIKKMDLNLKEEFKKRSLSIPLQWENIYNFSIKDRDESIVKRIVKFIKGTR